MWNSRCEIAYSNKVVILQHHIPNKAAEIRLDNQDNQTNPAMFAQGMEIKKKLCCIQMLLSHWLEA